MTEEKFREKLDSYSEYIVIPKGKIDKSNNKVQEFIQFYYVVTGEKVGDGTCKDCILEAFFKLRTLSNNQLKNLLMQKTYKLKPSNSGGVRLVELNGTHYTNANISDDVAFELVKKNRSNAANFENPEILLSDYDNQFKEEVKKVVVEKEKVEKNPNEEKLVTENAAVVPKDLTVSVTEKSKPKEVEPQVVEKEKAKRGPKPKNK